MDLVAQRESNGEIAQCLFIGEETVRNHLTNIFEKLGVDSGRARIVPARDCELEKSAATRNQRNPRSRCVCRSQRVFWLRR